AGVKTFMDEIDTDDTNDWGAEVGNALTSCGVMVLVVSPQSLEDPEVQGERLYFLRNGKIVVPVVAQETDKRPRGTFIMPVDCVTDYEAGKNTLLELLAPAPDGNA
ncbi:MAG: toll/interleukin-1 receptor domain-containing protein, partial [Chloroflexota bacterium]